MTRAERKVNAQAYLKSLLYKNATIYTVSGPENGDKRSVKVYIPHMTKGDSQPRIANITRQIILLFDQEISEDSDFAVFEGHGYSIPNEIREALGQAFFNDSDALGCDTL